MRRPEIRVVVDRALRIFQSPADIAVVQSLQREARVSLRPIGDARRRQEPRMRTGFVAERLCGQAFKVWRQPIVWSGCRGRAKGSRSGGEVALEQGAGPEPQEFSAAMRGRDLCLYRAR